MEFTSLLKNIFIDNIFNCFVWNAYFITCLTIAEIVRLKYFVLAVIECNSKFRSPTHIKEKSIVGGVTLNHLSWASLLGGELCITV